MNNKDWTPCDTKPCQNGGTCIPGVDDYSCQCLIDSPGKNCELRSTSTIPAISMLILFMFPYRAILLDP